MINYQTCDVYCDKCKTYLGNYNTCLDADGNEKSFYSLIRMKYCKECKKAVRRKQNRTAQTDYKRRRRVNKQVLEEQLRLMKAENKVLKIKLFGTDNAEQHQALVQLLKS